MGYELIHDTIAKQVYAKASTEARTRRKIEKFIAERHQAYLERNAALSQEDLDYITPYLKQVNISREQEAFLKESRKNLQRAARNRRNTIIAAIAVLAAISLFSIIQWQNANRQKTIAEEQRMIADSNLVKARAAEQQALQQEELAVRKSDSLNLVGLALNNSLDSLTQKEQALQRSLIAQRRTEILLQGSFDTLLEKERALQISLKQIQLARDSALAAQLEAVYNAELAQAAREQAVQKSIEAQASALVANARAVFQEDRTLALNLAFAAYRTHPNAEALAVLGEILQDPQSDFYQNAYYHSNAYFQGTGVTSIAVSSDGRRMLSGASDGTVRLWDLESGEKQDLETSHARPVKGLTFSSDGNFALGVSEDSTATLWSTLSGNRVQRLIQPYKPGVFREGTMHAYYTARLTAAAFSPSGKSILIGNDQGFVYHYQKTAASTEDQPEYEVERVFFLERKIPGKARKNMLRIVGGYSELQVRFLTEDQFIAYSGRGKAMSFKLDGSILEESLDIPNKDFRLAEFASLAVRPGEPFFLTANEVSGVSRIGPKGKEVLRLIDKPVKRMARIDDRRLLVVYPDDRASIWDMRGDSSLLEFSDMGTVNDLEIAPDRQSFFTADADGLIKEWKIDGLRGRAKFLLRSFETPRYYAFSGAANNLIINGKEYTPTGELVRTLGFLPAETEQLITSATAPGLFLCIQGKEATLWNEQGRKLNTLQHNFRITDACFSPDGRRILTASRDSTARLWSLDQDQPLRILADHNNGVSAVAFSPGGDTLLTAGRDSMLIIWPPEGKEPRKLKFKNAIAAAQITSDGKYAAVACNYPWMIEPNEEEEGKNGLVFFRGFNLGQIDDPIRNIMLIDLKTGAGVKSIRSKLPAETVQLSTNGQYLLYVQGNDQRTLVQNYGIPAMWDIASWKPLMIFQAGMENTQDAIFSPDGQFIFKTFGSKDRRNVITLQGGQLWVNPMRAWNPGIYNLGPELRGKYKIDVDY